MMVYVCGQEILFSLQGQRKQVQEEGEEIARRDRERRKHGGCSRRRDVLNQECDRH